MEYGFNQVVFLPRRVFPSCNIYNLTAYKNKGASWSHLGDLRKFCINLHPSTPQCLPPLFCVWPLWWVRSPISTHISVEIPQKHMHHRLLITDVVQAQHWLCGEIATVWALAIISIWYLKASMTCRSQNIQKLLFGLGWQIKIHFLLQLSRFKDPNPEFLSRGKSQNHPFWNQEIQFNTCLINRY